MSMWYYAHVCKSTLKVADIIKIIPHLQVQTYITFFFQPPPSEFMFWIVLASVPANQTAQQAFIQWDDCSN